MSTTVTELKGKRSFGIDKLRARTFRREFRVVTSDPLVGSIAVRTASGIPTIGQNYNVTGGFAESDVGSFVQQISGQEESEDGLSWIVTVEYGPYDASQFGINPVNWPVKLTFNGNKFQRIVWVDVNGNPVLNSAKERFQEPLTADDTRTTIVATRNELISGFDLTLAETYRDSTNNAVWNGFPAKYVKCGTISTGEPQYDSNAQVYFYTVTYPFEINRDTWDTKVLDQGFSYIDGTGKRLAVRDKNGQRPSDPSLLDGSGNVLPVTGTAVYRTFEIYPERNFSTFNLNFATALGR
jgi:hypothetical protein